MECGGKHPQTKAGNQTNNDVHPITTAAAAATVAGGEQDTHHERWKLVSLFSRGGLKVIT